MMIKPTANLEEVSASMWLQLDMVQNFFNVTAMFLKRGSPLSPIAEQEVLWAHSRNSAQLAPFRSGYRRPGPRPK
jgi:hypothetical protein